MYRGFVFLELVLFILLLVFFTSGCTAIDPGSLGVDPEQYDSLRIFVSSQKMSGDHGDPDAFCKNDDDNPQPSGEWKAVIGVDNRYLGGSDWVLLPETTYKRPDGVVIGTTNEQANFKFFLRGQLGGTEQLWTGLTLNGGLAANCNGWSLATGVGAVGVASSLHESLFFYEERDCSNRFAIICVEQPEATCTDGIANGLETDVDCGGNCGDCSDNAACRVASDCSSAVCFANICRAPSCTDGVINGDEEGKDCGGSCEACPEEILCTQNTECDSGFCSLGICQEPTCDDNIKNGAELGVDCGGSCTACEDLVCNSASDCDSGVCEIGICQSPTCDDNIQNGAETGIDCGGSCNACVVAPNSTNTNSTTNSTNSTNSSNTGSGSGSGNSADDEDSKYRDGFNTWKYRQPGGDDAPEQQLSEPGEDSSQTDSPNIEGQTDDGVDTSNSQSKNADIVESQTQGDSIGETVDTPKSPNMMPLLLFGVSLVMIGSLVFFYVRHKNNL